MYETSPNMPRLQKENVEMNLYPTFNCNSVKKNRQNERSSGQCLYYCVPFFLPKCLMLIESSVSSQCLKIIENVSFNIASEASYVFILSGQIQNAKKWSILAGRMIDMSVTRPSTDWIKI